MSHFFAYINRMRFINRWALMRNSYTENIQEHSHQVAVLAHAEAGGLADALSTGLFCLPEQTGRALADRNGWAVLWMHTDKSTAQSADWPQ